MKNTLICILCMGLAKVAPMQMSKKSVYDILEDESLTEVCSLVFNNNCEKNVPF